MPESATTGKAQLTCAMFPSPYLDTEWVKVRHPLLPRQAEALERLGCRCVPTPDYPSLRWLIANRRRIAVIHFHWPEQYYGPRTDTLLWELGGRWSSLRVHGLLRLWRLRWLYAFTMLAHWFRIPIVWTVHDLYPHGFTPADAPIAERIARSHLARRAGALVYNGAGAEPLVRQEFGAPRHAVVAPLGSHRCFYPDVLSAGQAREKMGMGPSDRLLLVFGTARPLRNALETIRIFRTLPDPRLRLVVAGQSPELLRREMEAAAWGDWRIRGFYQLVPNEDVEVLFKACDWVVIPGRAYLTSAVAVLALGYGRPVIMPRYGCAEDIVGDAGILYDPENPQALAEALRKAMASDVGPYQQRAAAQSGRFSWDRNAVETLKAYRAALADYGKAP